jgi:Tfp pilus assembly protein PilN
MKDIDLLPEWYTSGKRKQQSLRSQYIVLGGVVAIMVVWNLITASSLSTAKAQLDAGKRECVQARVVLEHAQEITGRIEDLNKKAKLLNDIDSRINIANLLSELSFLVDGKIVLSDVSFEARKLQSASQNNSSPSGIRVAGTTSKKGDLEPLGDVRFVVTLRGIADQTSDVGKFVRRLEESEYFRGVSLAFSRSKDIKVTTGGNNDQRQVSEFEISCELANYRIEQNGPGSK